MLPLDRGEGGTIFKAKFLSFGYLALFLNLQHKMSMLANCLYIIEILMPCSCHKRLNIIRSLDKCLGQPPLKDVYVQMMWRMLVGQLAITHSLRCLETSVLEITLRRKQLCGHGSFQQQSESKSSL